MEWPEFFAKLAREETHEELLLRERKQVQKAILKAKAKGHLGITFLHISSETAQALVNGGLFVTKHLYKKGESNAVAYQVIFANEK